MAGINIGGQIAQSLEQIPHAFVHAIEKGVEFNAFLETTRLGIAAALNLGYKDFSKSLEASGPAMDVLRQKAHDLGLSYEALLEQFQETSAAMQRGGVNDLEQQINLTIRLTKALTSLGITGYQATRDAIDILSGRAHQTVAARVLGLEDTTLKQAAESGKLYDLLIEKLDSFGKAGTLAADSSRIRNRGSSTISLCSKRKCRNGL